MKKWQALCLVLLTVVLLAGCTQEPSERGGVIQLSPTERPTEETAPPPTEAPTQPPEPLDASVLFDMAEDGSHCLCSWSRTGELDWCGILQSGVLREALEQSGASAWEECTAPGVNELLFDSYLTLSSQTRGGTLLTLWPGERKLCLDTGDGRIWLAQTQDGDLGTLLSEQADRSLEGGQRLWRSQAISVTGGTDQHATAESVLQALVANLNEDWPAGDPLALEDAQAGQCLLVEKRGGNRIQFDFTYRVLPKAEPDSEAFHSWSGPDGALGTDGMLENARRCTLVRDPVGFWHPTAFTAL